MLMRRAFYALTVVAMLVGAAPALAQADIVIIDIDRIVRGAEGEIIEVASIAVDPALVGATCSGSARIENNSSEHPDNDFIIKSGGSTAEILDYERLAGQITSMTGTLVLGHTVTASIRLGPDRVASEGVTIELSCLIEQVPPPTTTTTTTTTTTQPPERPAPTTTTTTEPAPVGGVSAGGGSTADTGVLAVAWTMAGFVTLLGALALAVRGNRRISSGD
jgi:hypothetical protein